LTRPLLRDIGVAENQDRRAVMDDDEDSFLYGESTQPVPLPPAQKTPVDDTVVIIPVLAEATEKQTNGVIAHLEAEAEAEVEAAVGGEVLETSQDGNGESEDAAEGGDEGEGDREEEEEEEEGEDESDDDIEFILEPPTRSLDFRTQRSGQRPSQVRTPSAVPQGTPVPSANLTTEYTPRERGPPAADVLRTSPVQAPILTPETSVQPSSATPANDTPPIQVQPASAEQRPIYDGPDPSTLPPARAPPSHPSIDPNVPGMFDGRSVFDIDMTNLAEKPWRRPGSDLSDWFNYGFDEISWEAYCYRRRALGDMADVLKANVLGFAGMPEEQLLALPPDARTMVMTGTNAMLTAGGPGGGQGVGVGVGPPGMMPPVGMNPMGGMNPMMAAEMGGMGGMNPMAVGMGGPMGMGMNGNMGVGMPGPGPGQVSMMQDGPPNGSVQVPGQGSGIAGSSVTPEQGGQMPLPDGLQGPGPGMMGMNMGGDFGGMQMQDGSGIPNQQIIQQMGQQMGPQMGQQMFPGMENGGTPTPTPVPVPPRSVPVPN
ncbi:hypothetical protein EW145_g7913, partial [Phellinidium pouzarii]